jgi:predicted  nucleic acid-binding Zn-ribbon protein
MIVTDEQVKSVEESCKMHSALKRSHLEANARIRELEAELLAANQVIDGLAKYVDRADRAEALVLKLVAALEAADEEIFHNIDEYNGQHVGRCVSCQIDAALKAAKGE